MKKKDRKAYSKAIEEALSIVNAHVALAKELRLRSIPIPKFNPGSNRGGPAIVGEGGKEVVYGPSRLSPIMQALSDSLQRGTNALHDAVRADRDRLAEQNAAIRKDAQRILDANMKIQEKYAGVEERNKALMEENEGLQLALKEVKEMYESCENYGKLYSQLLEKYNQLKTQYHIL